MSDIHCLKCSEPWDAYGVQNAMDMTRGESYRFLKGEGCPSCKFGEETVSQTPLQNALDDEAENNRIVDFLWEMEDGLDGDEALDLAMSVLGL